MKPYQLLATLGAALSLSGCKPPTIGITQSVEGIGKVTTENRSVSGFHAVSMNTSGSLEIVQGDSETLTISADDNVLPLLTSEVNDGQLTLGVKNNGVSLKSKAPIVYKLTVKQLDGVTLAGSGEVNGKGIQTAAMNVNVAGSGDISLEGSADEQQISVAGSGNFHGEKLKGKSGKINIAGSGNAAVSVGEKLAATIMGSGSVNYADSPEVTKTILGSGSVSKR